MSYNFKKIIDLDLVNEVPEGANVLIETDGATKRLPSTAIKPTPIQPDFTQNDPTAPDYVKNRTHYEETAVVNEPLNITWDGNTEGKVSVDRVDGFGVIACKVSDAILTKEQIEKGFSFVAKGYEDSPYSEQDLTINSIENSLVFALQKDEIGFISVHNDNTEWYDFVFPEKGLYFTVSYAFEEPAYILSFTTTEPVEHTKTAVHKLDKKYLPDDIGGYTIFYVDFIDEKIYIDESIETEANSVDVETALSKGVIYFKKAHTGELYNSFELETGDSGYYIRILTMNYGNVNVQSVATSDFIGGAD